MRWLPLPYTPRAAANVEYLAAWIEHTAIDSRQLTGSMVVF